MSVTVEDEEFVRLIDPLRAELVAYCRRMLGTGADAEDAVQETWLRALRSHRDADLQGAAALRGWMYRIATNVCLTALDQRSRRAVPVPDGPYDLPSPPEADPAAVAESRETMRLALLAACRSLPGRQSAALILRDALGWRAGEVAELLGTTGAAVNSMLQRARVRRPEASAARREPADPRVRAMLDRYVTAMENADAAELARLLTEDAECEVPPATVRGREAILRFLAAECPAFGDCRLRPVVVGGRPAVVTYRRGAARPVAVDVLTVTPSGIRRIVSHRR
ncbi:MAG TPA: RNA polymerase subunit sigma-70 [Thermomonospora sp.]|nr:RNA polymerase subunit sigma-70 [Thermomonospora sp.]